MQNYVLLFSLVLTRVGAFVTVLPLFGGVNVPRLVKAGLAFALATVWFGNAAVAMPPELLNRPGRGSPQPRKLCVDPGFGGVEPPRSRPRPAQGGQTIDGSLSQTALDKPLLVGIGKLDVIDAIDAQPTSAARRSAGGRPAIGRGGRIATSRRGGRR